MIAIIAKALIIYIIQVGSLWGALEGYTYFKGDALKSTLGEFWILMYILPVFTTLLYILWQRKNIQTTVNRQQVASTEGDFSPGIVERNYSVKAQSPDVKRTSSRKKQDTGASREKDKPLIQTKGNYSPGSVGGDYKVE